MSEEAYKKYPHHLDNPENIKIIRRLGLSNKKLEKTHRNLIKQKAFRIWVQNNPKINLIVAGFLDNHSTH